MTRFAACFDRAPARGDLRRVAPVRTGFRSRASTPASPGVATAPVRRRRATSRLPPAGTRSWPRSTPVGGRVLRSRLLLGRFTVPGRRVRRLVRRGLSADGRTLVLIQPAQVASPGGRRPLPSLDTQTPPARNDRHSARATSASMRSRPTGACSTSSSTSRRDDPTRYLVRLYDLERGRLLPKPIIDPREVGDVMRGMPVTRSYSPDGRFAYTLYDGAGEHPFIHALDTVGKTARCIDLHGLTGFAALPGPQLDVVPDGGRSRSSPAAGRAARPRRHDGRARSPSRPPRRTPRPQPGDARRRRHAASPWLLVAARHPPGLLAPPRWSSAS